MTTLTASAYLEQLKEITAAHATWFCNRACLTRSKEAGCFHCMNVFPAGDVTEFVQRADQAAICPRCGIDSVVGDASRFPVTNTVWLRKMNEHWFGSADVHHAAPQFVPTSACDECGHRSVATVVFDVEVAGSDENYTGKHHVCARCLGAASALFDKKQPEPAPVAAVALVWKDHQVLCVWNKRYGGWSLPGGKVEAGETSFEGLRRELREETALDVVTATLVFSGPHNLKVESTRGSRVDLYFVDAVGDPHRGGGPQQMELGCPVKWVHPTAFITPSPVTPFAEFYKDVFVQLEDRVRDGLLPPWVLGR